jgi:hypothetical protein
MTPENDLFLTRLAVRIEESTTGNPIGSGIIYNSQTFADYILILTAAHCLYYDKDKFQEPRNEVRLHFYNPELNTYKSVNVSIDYKLVASQIEKDVAVFKLNRSQIEKITGQLPVVNAATERGSVRSFVLKGFPSATKGKEIVLTRPEFDQDLPIQQSFQLFLKEDFTTAASAEPKVDGFSGSGVFIENHNNLYLLGIFTRFRDAQKVIYCKYINSVNELLEMNFLPLIPFTYIGEYGLTKDFFLKYNTIAISNLGPRFNEILNFRLPIAYAFHDAAKDIVFKRRLIKCLDSWLLSNDYSLLSDEINMIGIIKSDLNNLKKSTTQWLQHIKWKADEHIDLTDISSALDTINMNIRIKRNELYELQRQERKKETAQIKKVSYGQQEIYDTQIYRLREIERVNDNLLYALDEIFISLSNSPVLIIKGEPGCGKSHLLGDIANKSLKNSTATILLLGQLFSKSQTIWQNILDQLGINCTKDELLRTLNSIGKQQGSRFLIMIDALNEGPGKDLWYDSIAGFIEEILRYPFLGLVLTIRSTYFNNIIPLNVQNDPRITKIVHQGFKGNEYAALKLFCEHYTLETPNFPILAPEFINPLFLQLICQGVKASGEKKFPLGFQGITKVFGYYSKAIQNKISSKREDYLLRNKLVYDAIYLVADACFAQEESRVLNLEDAVELFDSKFPKHQHLLSDLIQENVFIQTTHTDYRTTQEREVLYFSYERFGDFFMAEKLLKDYKNPEDVLFDFKKGNKLGKLLEDGYWRYNGVLEALSVRLPEMFNLEIIEVYSWAFNSNDQDLIGNIDEWLSNYLWDSLKWRNPENIDNKKITKWIKSDNCKLHNENWFLRLVELTTVHNHPFNSDRLYNNLIQYSMPERDELWQWHLRYYSGYDDDGNAYPIRRLIDWSWHKGISKIVDTETARLAGQTLVWFLSSTHRQLRDQTTKALVNLLEEQPEALLQIMEAFKTIDDFYIAERLYAVAYGCALRTSKDENLKSIAQYVYDTCFKKGEPPVHVLLRDYARNTIEYSLYKNVNVDIDVHLIRPPYRSTMPTVMPTKKYIERYNTKFNDSDSANKKTQRRLYVQIYHSTMNWDFGQHEVENAVRDFAPISFTIENEFINFKKSLKRNEQMVLKTIVSNIELKATIQKRKNNSWNEIIGKSFEDILKILKATITQEKWELFEKKFLPYLDLKFTSKEYPRDSLDPEPIKRWIVKRAFKLGYNVNMHGLYDEHAERNNERYDKKIDRIGMKYQRIALHEIVARIGDNYKFEDETYSSGKRYSFYKGPWQNYLRDIDPVFITKNPVNEEDDEIPETFKTDTSGWWFDIKYDYWDQIDLTWIDNSKDLPLPQNIIQRRDDFSAEWIYLKLNCGWEQPKLAGQDKYNRPRKKIWYMLNAYLIPKKDNNKFVGWLNKQSFWGRWMPENKSTNLSLFNRENYWSPVSESDNSDRKIWASVQGTKQKVITTTSQAVGEMGEDKSGAHAHYYMPCKTIFDGMGLEYASEDGSFKNSAGEIIVTNINPQGVLVRKKELIEFLDKNDYDIVWTLLGEKNSINMGAFDRNANHFRAISGVYHFDKDAIVGQLTLSNRD